MNFKNKREWMDLLIKQKENNDYRGFSIKRRGEYYV